MNSTMSERMIGAQDPSMSVYMLQNGSATANASTLDPTLLHPFESTSPPSGMADMTKALNISQTGIVTWVMNRDPYIEAATPVLYGNSSEGWNANTTLHLPFNSTFDIIMSIADDSMDKVGPSQRYKPICKRNSDC